jgi:predicted ribosome quality control (RQC) complex YloA/Tae2 family protein
MNFDVFTISALTDEFMDTLVGGRIQNVINVDAMGLGLEIYAHSKRRYLYLSADSDNPRVHVMDDKLRRGIQKPTQIGLLFRSYVDDGIITHVSQPSWERIMHIDVEGEKGEVTIIIEPMVRRANVLLVKDGIILDCMKRVGPEENRYRLSLPNHAYVPPPPMKEQLDPSHVTVDDFCNLLESIEKKTAQMRRALTGHILGMSPLLAREIVFRATGTDNTKVRDSDADTLYDAYKAVFDPLLKRDWQSGVGQTDGVVSAFSPYPLTFVDWQPTETMSGAITAFYGSITGPDAYNEAKKPVQAAVEETKIKLSSKLKSLKSGLRDDTELEVLKQSGELILAYQYGIQAEQTELRAQYEYDAPELVIKLNTEHTPLENAQDYFRKYEKAKSARDDVPRLIKATQLELDYIEQLETDLMTALNWVEIDDVIQTLQTRGHWLGKKLKRLGGGGRQGALKIVSRDGYVVWVGRNSRQNEKVTFKTANSQDIWLHARDVPGAHVIIRNDGRRIKDELIAEAAAVAAFYSKRRNDGNVLVDYTRVKYVNSIRGAGPGMVTYRNEQTITVEPQDEKILK